MYNFTTHPLFFATESDEYKEQLNNLEFRAKNICASKLSIFADRDKETVNVEEVSFLIRKL